MKKILLFLTIATLALASCSKNDEAPVVFSDTSIQLYVGQTHQLFNGDADTSSDSAFIASLSSSGLVTANHVGQTNVRAGGATCAITVKPRLTLYPDPYMKWGATKATVKAVLGTPVQETATMLGYLTSSSPSVITMYNFPSGVLENAAVSFNNVNYISKLPEFLSERYQLVNTDTNSSIIATYTNGSIGVYVYMDGGTCMVMYARL